MKIKLLILSFLVGLTFEAFTQLPQDTYRKPLKEVLADIEKRHDIKIQYSESLVKGLRSFILPGATGLIQRKLLQISSCPLI
jgi:hypothetical protein